MKPPSEQPAIRMMMMPKDTNALGSIFGGVILSLIDQAAFVEASRQASRKYVTIAMDKIEFHKPVKMGDIVSLWAETIRIGRSSIRLRVDVLARSRSIDEEVRVTSAEVTMVAIDEQGNPTPIHVEDPDSAATATPR
ncbi:acyl-CoA thioesterase [Thioalkalivibrio sp. XN8]|uniref:acyl-CoA thioesterase n=1 Tax=Thioalkalivibrio sp. XN8 TaxID=2712863 RepID=UPI0013EE2074|nr:acyl-CoA thioesterase [Thioalkalivibrio sp. XN8]NGP53871.1 acyl-CoA thioesterase [Thioalkalivibrio sp. XN8]